MITASDVIKILDLQPLDGEGGFFKQTYKAVNDLNFKNTFCSKIQKRSFSTAIYYLITQSNFSALHKLPIDEIYHFYLGSPVKFTIFDESNSCIRDVIMGCDLLNDQVPQFTVKAGLWQALKIYMDGEFALLGTTMSPGFEFEDMMLAEPCLLERFPDKKRQLAGLIK